MRGSTVDARLRRTFAQWFCVVAGVVLTLGGILGFVADGSFDTGSHIQGDSFLGFEVNGWHNLFHLASGLILLAAANTRPTAKSVAIAFGVIYLFVTLWGAIDGDEVFNLMPVNPADNLLHLVLGLLALGCAYVSPTTKGQQRSRARRRFERRRAKDEDRERRDFIAETEAEASPRRGRWSRGA